MESDFAVSSLALRSCDDRIFWGLKCLSTARTSFNEDAGAKLNKTAKHSTLSETFGPKFCQKKVHKPLFHRLRRAYFRPICGGDAAFDFLSLVPRLRKKRLMKHATSPLIPSQPDPPLIFPPLVPPLNGVLLPPSAGSAIRHPRGEFMFPVPGDL